MRELRSTIYRLSSKKGGQQSFKEGIIEYINTLSKLNDVDIDFQIDGDEELLGISMKRGLYRVICEAVGNAIRHGRCSLIRIVLSIDITSIVLSICDNGKGFNNDTGKDRNRGLGICNMTRIVETFGGQIDIDGQPDKGTSINIKVPNDKIAQAKRGGLAI